MMADQGNSVGSAPAAWEAALENAGAGQWKVVANVAINVRAGGSLRARLLGTKKPGAEVRGEPEDGWLKLLDEPGYMRIRSDFCPFLLPTAVCTSIGEWVGAATVFDHLETDLAEARRGLSAGSRVPKLQLPPPGMYVVASAELADDNAAAAQPQEPLFTVNLAQGTQEGLAGPATDATASWLSRARLWMQRLDPKATVPPTARLPQSAVHWDPAAAVLNVLTHGHFDPDRDVPQVGDAQRVQQGLLSVCCVTSDRRRTFHPLIYENFRKQTHEARELVVIHTGEVPSDFFQEKARTDPRVVYRFFPASLEAPGSPRLTDDKTGSPWDAVLVDDDPAELSYWEQGDPWTWEIPREGWTKGIKRNVACCVARGSILAHFDDGCLYAPTYLARMLAELEKMGGAGGVMAATLARWYTVSIADVDFRLVDLRRPEPMWELYGQTPKGGQDRDVYNHGFVYIYTRAAWELQPFPDVETVGTKDSDFMKGLRGQGMPVRLIDAGTQEALAAVGWHRDATCGSKDVPANINDAQVLDFLRFRGEEARTPQAFGELLRLVREVASDLHDRRERYLEELVKKHGSLYCCAYCNFAVGLVKNAQAEHTISTSMQVVDGYDMTKTYAKQSMKFDVCTFSKAGGAVAEGHWTHTPSGAWLAGKNQRMALCRNCGFQLGWRFEPQGLPRECSSPCCTYQAADGRDHCCIKCRLRGPHCEHAQDCEKKETPQPQAPLLWGLIWRHLRQRKRRGERVPDEEAELSRHKETQHNRKRNDVCPDGHILREFCTGQGNGGALPFYYICDVCDRTARGSEHLWGCGICDYDMCQRCHARRR